MNNQSPKWRYAWDPVDVNPALRIEANERITALQLEALGNRLDRIESAMMRLEKRLWITLYGIIAVVLAQAFQSLLTITP